MELLNSLQKLYNTLHIQPNHYYMLAGSFLAGMTSLVYGATKFIEGLIGLIEKLEKLNEKIKKYRK